MKQLVFTINSFVLNQVTSTAT